ncbi:MAG: glycyl-radical enzyme activating protein [Bacillota bacterium]|jgi:pyruvate formate lyase activating enzyme|nr:glycyl-radical enzyme activating protein [Bacillota bacterium]HHU43369.1 glycyl-radical enzyme activating protein [Clostridiales bacterium]
MKTYILDIQKMSTEDGPGIRTTVFFKGCNLKCKWCQNPESIPFYRQKYWIKDKCMGCLSCLECPQKAISFDEDGLKFEERLCNFCLWCAEQCPTNAIEVKGREIEISELVNELLKDKVFYEKSGGGVTLSGGEAALHWEYAYELMDELKKRGIHTALDTAGCYPYKILQKLLEKTDLLLYDIKHIDNEKHKEFTDVENTLILQNAKRVGSLEKPEVWVRTPIIPDSTDSEENIKGIGKFIKENMPNITKWELVTFNNLCKNKYQLLNRDWGYENKELIQKEKIEKLWALAKKYHKNAVWSGATKLEV